MLQYAATGGIWYVQSDDLALGQLDSRYVQPTQLPILLANTLDYTGVTDSYAAFAALLAKATTMGGAHIMLGPGTINLSAAGGVALQVPINCPITVSGPGEGALTINLSANVPCLWGCFWAADGQAYQNFRTYGYTVNANNVTGVSIFPNTQITANASIPNDGSYHAITLSSVAGFPSVAQTGSFGGQTSLVFFQNANSGTAAGLTMVAQPGSGSTIMVKNSGASTVTVVSGDFLQGASRAPALFGNHALSGAPYTNMTFDEIHLWDIKVINIPTMTAASLSTPKADLRYGIILNLHINGSNLPSSPLSATRCTFDVELWGGEVGVGISGDVGTFIDQCGTESNFKHSTLVTPTSNYPSYNVLFGSSAWVGKVWVKGWGELSGDVGVELDQPWEADVSHMLIEDAFTAAYYSTSFTYPARTSAGPPTTTLNGAITSGASSLIVASLPANIAMEGWLIIDSELMWYQVQSSGTTFNIYRTMNGSTNAAHSSGATVTFHEQQKTRILYTGCRAIRRRVTSTGFSRGWNQITNSFLPLPRIDGVRCEYEREGTDFNTIGEAFMTNGVPAVDMQLKARINGINYTSATSATAAAISFVGVPATTNGGITTIAATGPRPTPIKFDLDIQASGILGSGAIWYSIFSQVGYWDLDITYKNDSAFPGVSAAQTTALEINSGLSGGTQTVQGIIRCLGDRVAIGDGAHIGLTITGTSKVTVRFLEVEDRRPLQKFTASTNNSNYHPFNVDPTNADAVFIRQAVHSLGVTNGYPMRPLKRRVITGGSVTLNAWDTYIALQLTSAATITLADGTSASGDGINPAAGEPVIFKDESGNLATFNATLTAAGTDTIDGAATLVMNTNRQVTRLIATGAGYAVI